MCSQPELPTEIWVSIASLLSSTDLAHLCRTSTLYLSISRPILYRSVDISGVEATFKTFSLLSSNTSLAEGILELTIRPPLFEFNPNLLDSLLDILPLLTSVKKFSVVGNAIFPKGQKRFLEIMKEKKPPLEEFSFTESSGLALRWNEDRLNLRTLAGLKKVSWSINDIYMIRWGVTYYGILQQVLSASIETIESITIDFYFRDLDFLWEMRLPALRRLDLGSVRIYPGEVTFSLSKFLNAHPGIEELRIGSNRYHLEDDEGFSWNWEKLITSNPDPHFRDLLVTLRSYTGSIEGFISLFTWKCRCLRDSLEELVFELDGRYLGDIEKKFEVLHKVFRGFKEVLGGLKLKRLHFPLMFVQHATRLEAGFLSRGTSYSWFPNLLDNCLEIVRFCAPSLEYYQGPIPISYDELLSFLTSFPNLKQLCICSRHARDDKLEENKREEEIAKVCKSLEKIVVISDNSGSDVICWKEVVRKKPGNEVLRIETYWQPQIFE